MAKGIFQQLDFHEALLFAAVIPRDAKMPSGWVETEFLRKDLTFMFERFYYLLEDKDTTGLIVMDQTENQADRRFVRRLANYFKKTQNGILRSRRIVPSPVFVSSDMTYPVQAADVCIYCLNLGFRLPSFGMTEPVRKEIEENFEGWIRSLQFQCTRKDEAGFAHARWGIVYVQDPY